MVGWTLQQPSVKQQGLADHLHTRRIQHKENLGTSRSGTLRAKNKLWDDRRLSARQVAQSAIKEMPDFGTLDFKGGSPNRCFVCN